MNFFSRVKLFSEALSGICEGDPLSPPFQSFIFRYPLTVCSKKARVDVTPSARGSIAIEFGGVVRISNEQFFSQ
jgi:hypothetical protein